MSLELFINSGSISEIDLSRIDGVRFEDALSVASTTCASLYYNTQEFSIPPITPPGTLNIPQTNYFMFDDDASSDWNASTPTKIRISLKAIGRIIDRTSYQQKLFDIIKNSRVDSEITLTKMPTLNEADPTSFKKFKVVEANYLERTYDESGQKFYALEWGTNDLTETVDSTGLFDYFPSSDDQKDGFFTLTVTQIDGDVNSSEPPQQGDELLICIKPSTKYGLLDVIDGTFDDLVSNTSTIISASVGSLTVSGEVAFSNSSSIEKIIENTLTPARYERIVCTTAQYVPIPEWAKTATVSVVGGGGGGGAGVDLNDAHFTIGGSGGSGGSITVMELNNQLTIDGESKNLGGIKSTNGFSNTPNQYIYAQIGQGGKGAEVANHLVIRDEDEAFEKFKNAWNNFSNKDTVYGTSNIQYNNQPINRYNGFRPYFYGLNIDYAYSLIIGHPATQFLNGQTSTYETTSDPIYPFKLNIPNNSEYVIWNTSKNYPTEVVVTPLSLPNLPANFYSKLDIIKLDKIDYNYIILNPESINAVAKTNLRKMYISNPGEDGTASFAYPLDLNDFVKETDSDKKLELLKKAHFEALYGEGSWEIREDGMQDQSYDNALKAWTEEIGNNNDNPFGKFVVLANGGTGGIGGIAIKYSKNIKKSLSLDDISNWTNPLAWRSNVYYTTATGGLRRTNFISNTFPLQNTSINQLLMTHVFTSRYNWSVQGYGGILEFIKNDIVYANNLRYTKLYNPIPLVEAASTIGSGYIDGQGINGSDNLEFRKPLDLDSIWSTNFEINTSRPFGMLFSLLNSDSKYRNNRLEYYKKAKVKYLDFRGGLSGYGVVEPLHNSSIVDIKGRLSDSPIDGIFNQPILGPEVVYKLAEKLWSTDKSLEYFNGDYEYITNKAPKLIRIKPADYCLNSSPNSPADWITDTSPSYMFMVRKDIGVYFSRLRKLEIPSQQTPLSIMELIDQTHNAQNIVAYLFNRPFNVINTTPYKQKDHTNDTFVGVTGGAGGLGWSGFDPIGKNSDTNEIIDIMDMPSSYLAQLRTEKSVRFEKDFVTLTFFNYDNYEHIKVGKGGGHFLKKEGDQIHQLGGDGGNAIRRWIYENDSVKTILPVSLPNNTPPSSLVETWGAGGGAGGSGGIDISNNALVTFTTVETHGTKKATVFLDDLLDENNEWRKVGGQNGSDGRNGIVIIEFRD